MVLYKGNETVAGGVLEMTRGGERREWQMPSIGIGRGVMMLWFMVSAGNVLIESRLLNSPCKVHHESIHAVDCSLGCRERSHQDLVGGREGSGECYLRKIDERERRTVKDEYGFYL